MSWGFTTSVAYPIIEGALGPTKLVLTEPDDKPFKSDYKLRIQLDIKGGIGPDTGTMVTVVRHDYIEPLSVQKNKHKVKTRRVLVRAGKPPVKLPNLPGN